MEQNKHIILYGTPSKGRGLLLFSKTSQCENNACTHVFALLGEAHLTNQHTSHELHYILSM